MTIRSLLPVALILFLPAARFHRLAAAFSSSPTITTVHPKTTAPPDDDEANTMTSDRKIHVGNLDWTVSDRDTIDMLLRAVDHDPGAHVTIKELSPERQKRKKKHHAGSAIVAFSTPADAVRGMEALRALNDDSKDNKKKELRLRWAPTFDSFRKRKKNVKQSVTPEVLTAEVLEQRKQRAEKYARQRARVAVRTDEVIARALLDPNNENGDSTRGGAAAAPTTEVLRAPVLDWSGDCPAEADPVRGGGLHEGTARGERKRAAVEAFLFVLTAALLDDNNNDDGEKKGRNNNKKRRCATVADLGCGAGNLSIPLAWWLRKERGCGVLGVDYNGIALDRLVQRAVRSNVRVEALQKDLRDLAFDGATMDGGEDDTCIAAAPPTGPAAAQQQHEELAGCEAVVSLHACGIASDLAMAAAITHSLPFAISPCCVGKVKKAWRRQRTPGSMPNLEQQRSGSSSDDDGGGNNNEETATPVSSSFLLSYPRSEWMNRLLRDPGEEYRLLASAADYGVVYDHSKTTGKKAPPEELARRQRCKRAKRLVETDRLQWARERGYEVRMLELPRIGPLYPKRELLLGAKKGSPAAARIAALPTTTTTG